MLTSGVRHLRPSPDAMHDGSRAARSQWGMGSRDVRRASILLTQAGIAKPQSGFKRWPVLVCDGASARLLFSLLLYPCITASRDPWRSTSRKNLARSIRHHAPMSHVPLASHARTHARAHAHTRIASAPVRREGPFQHPWEIQGASPGLATCRRPPMAPAPLQTNERTLFEIGARSTRELAALEIRARRSRSELGARGQSSSLPPSSAPTPSPDRAR